jgi:multidrug efflux pump subunit AcrA (membrane-fusion protein)
MHGFRFAFARAKLVALALVVLMLVVCCASGCGGGGPSSRTALTQGSGGDPPQAAVEGTSRLLAWLQTVAGTSLRQREPAAARGRLAQPVPGVVDRHVVADSRFWATQRQPAVVLAQLGAEGRALGGRLGSKGSRADGGLTSYWWETLSVPPASHRLRAEEIRIAVARSDGGGFVVRGEVRAAWRPMRPASSLMSRSFAAVAVIVARPATFAAHLGKVIAIRRDSGGIGEVASVVNSLPAGEQESNINCAPSVGTVDLWLRFQRPTARQVLVEVSPQRCGEGGVWISISNGPRTLLTEGDRLVLAVERKLHVRLRTLFR